MPTKTMMKILLLISVLSLSNICVTAYAADTLPLSDAQIKTLKAYLPSDDNLPLLWKGEPLSVSLQLNTEKRLMFPEPVEANLNGALNNDQLRIINNDQSLYLTALKSFSSTRMYVNLKNSHKIILMDIVASESTDQSSVKPSTQVVRISEQMPNIQKDASHMAGTSNAVIATQWLNHADISLPKNDVSNNSADDYVHAIRFAWQQLYAPERLLNRLNQDAAFTRTPMHTQPWVSSLIYGDKVLAHPSVSWVSDNMYVTVVELRNKYAHSTNIDVKKDVCGQWQAAALYPRQMLKPAGDKTGDSTMLFLISDKPFGDVLESCHART